ncbi:hypothetical protein SAMN05421770_102179 [Granulicella rosea]|uniref:LTD domain-containing protein n=1 Tax=Granulicella rosea TaxID=474952 RepID=A0A239H159_9BACT|nr:choice-of-anchor D domain-containing protein [Granulicella rosea]SNS75117.1 hypothetical protein SAMN05421770_102179 [Granulicella rosea]
MHTKFSAQGVLRALIVFVFSIFAVHDAFAVSNTVVISQVYGAGGNSGSNLSEDYVELFNLGTTPVSLTGWSLQYRSATGTGAFTSFALPSGAVIQPGQFYLVGASAAGSGAALPTPDAQLTISLSGTAGQIALSSSTVALTGCPAAPTADPAIVDFVGYGTTATCSEGLAPTATLTATTSASRKNVCTDTDNNAADFSVGADVPRNSATATQVCSGTATFGVSASASPTTVNVGSTTLFTARVTKGATSSGIAVTADLSTLGGSSTQPLYDDGTHGDTTAGDNVFNYLATVGSGATAGVKTVKLSATDAQAEASSATLAITVTATSAVTPIHTIQAGAPASSYLGQTVTTTGIVTALGNGGFYLEARDSAQDADPTTSEGIFVVSGTNASVVVGNELNVTGTVSVTSSSSATAATEINGTVTMTVVSTGNTLPTPVSLTAANDSPTGGFQQFLRYQSMRVLIPSFTTTAPTGGTLAETTETVTSDGTFWGVVTGVARPFVEPGISVLEPSLPSGTPATVPRFDGNPELIYVSSTFLGGAALNVTSNQTITNFLGIFDFTTNTAVFAPDKAAPGTLGAPMTVVVAPKPAANEFTIASMNVERFYSDTAPGNGGLTLTTPAYQGRLSKLSLLIRNVLGSPDIVGMQEMGTLSTLTALASKISTDAIAAGQTDPKYLPYLIQGNDSSGINTAFLVSPNRVTVSDVSQFGKATTFTNSTGVQAVLNDRPPLVLHAIVNIPGYTAYPVTVISNHLKALTGEDDTTSTGATVRLKKEAQAEFLANLIQGYQNNGEHVVSLGDYNAFPFNDGYVDVVGVVRGNPVAAGQSVITGTPNLVSPNMTDLVTTITDPAQQYDYTYIGNAQSLDHILTTSNITGAHLFYVHEDSDFPLINYNDPTTPLNTSDHDGGVAYFPLLQSGQTSTATLTPATQDFGSIAQGTASATKPIVFTNTGNTALTVTSVVATGDFAQTNNCTTVAAGATCTVNVAFTPTTTGARTGSLTVVSSSITNRTLVTSLTGTGLSASATLALNPSTLGFASLVAGGVSTAQSITLTNTGGVAATLGTIAATGDFTQTNTCGTSVASLGNCTISVTFRPTAVGARTGTLSIPVTAPAGVGTLSASLNGTAAAQASLSAAAAFPTTITGKTSAAQTVTLTNLSTSAITLSSASISVGTNFTQTNNCGATLAASATCTISVVFAPTSAGALTGALTVTPTIGAVSTTITTALSGTAQSAPDFALTPTSQAGSLVAGTSASTTLTLSSLGGYTGKVAIACSGAPAGSTCALSTGTLVLALNPTTNLIPSLNLNVVISTSKASGAGFGGLPGRSGTILMLVALGSAVLMFSNRRKLRGAALFLALLTVSVWTTGCGSGGNSAAPTPTGSYVYTITATDGALTHTATYNLTVQ